MKKDKKLCIPQGEENTFPLKVFITIANHIFSSLTVYAKIKNQKRVKLILFLPTKFTILIPVTIQEIIHHNHINISLIADNIQISTLN